MTPEQIDRVFGRGRLKMVTGEHVEVFREAVRAGERRRYTKRFLNTAQGDFAHWTEREWRILARLIGHGIGCVPEVVQFDRGSVGGMQLVQTYDAGVTVDQWATLLPLARNGRVYRHAFEDCAHWWALAHHCLLALREIHQLQLVHLDVKGDNVCIPLGPADFDPDEPGQRLHPMFGQLALIDFAFALVSREALTTPLPIGWQREYDYQSPRLLKALEDGRNGDLTATRELDWRCDMYSLAAMLKRYLPDDDTVQRPERTTGWTPERHEAAKGLIVALREHHDRDAPDVHPHPALIDATGGRLRERDLALSLAFGWTFARDADVAPVGASPLTPMTRLAPPIRVLVPPRERASDSRTAPAADRDAIIPLVIPPRDHAGGSSPHRARMSRAALAGVLVASIAVVAAAVVASFPDAALTALDRARTWTEAARPRVDAIPSAAQTAAPATASAAPNAPAAQAAALPPELPDAHGAGPAAATAGPPPEASPRPLAAAPAKAATAAHLASGAPDRRAPASSPSLSAQSSKPASATVPQRNATALSASRFTTPAHRAPSTTALRSGAAPAATREPAPRPAAETPKVQAAKSSPAPSQVDPSPPATSPSSPPPIAASPKVEDAKSAPVPPSIASASSRPPAAPRREFAQPPGKDRRAEAGVLSRLFNLAGAQPAPIEDRRAQPAAAPRPATAALPPPPSAAQPAPIPAPGPLIAPPSAPPAVEEVTRSAPSEPRPAAPLAATPTPRAIEPLATSPAPRTVEPLAMTPAPRAAPPAPAPQDLLDEDALPDRDDEEAFALQARRALTLAVPRMAAQAQYEIQRVLWVAAHAHDATQERAVVEAAQTIRIGEDGSLGAQGVSRAQARRLNAEAMHAYWSRRDVAQAFDLQLKAFGANPYDPEIAGNLASLHLKPGWMQPETARQLALVALAARGPRHRAGRLEDWNTYAVASALSGRDADARNALFVGVALARNVDNSCRTALGALANYGERLREPVEAMIYRIHAQGRGYESPYCTWPPTRPGMRLRP